VHNRSELSEGLHHGGLVYIYRVYIYMYIIHIANREYYSSFTRQRIGTRQQQQKERRHKINIYGRSEYPNNSREIPTHTFKHIEPYDHKTSTFVILVVST
jgi:hypothetical protein